MSLEQYEAFMRAYTVIAKDAFANEVITHPMENRFRYPHCDQNVLHAPGECEYCDKLPEVQQARERFGVNFTGHYDQHKVLCPAERLRPETTINKWGGNRPARGTNG